MNEMLHGHLGKMSLSLVETYFNMQILQKNLDFFFSFLGIFFLGLLYFKMAQLLGFKHKNIEKPTPSVRYCSLSRLYDVLSSWAGYHINMRII